MVDGAPFPASGTLPAGRHVVTVIRAGFDSWEHEVALVPGQNPDLAVTLVPQDAYRKEFESRALRRRYWAWATGAAGLAVGAAAVGVFLWNDQRYADWEQKKTDNHLKESIKTVDGVTIALGVAGGALLATGAVLYFTGDNPARYRVGVSAAPGGASLSGQFAF